MDSLSTLVLTFLLNLRFNPAIPISRIVCCVRRTRNMKRTSIFKTQQHLVFIQMNTKKCLIYCRDEKKQKKSSTFSCFHFATAVFLFCLFYFLKVNSCLFRLFFFSGVHLAHKNVYFLEVLDKSVLFTQLIQVQEP